MKENCEQQNEMGLVETLAKRLVFQSRCWKISGIIKGVIGIALIVFGFVTYYNQGDLQKYSVVLIMVGVLHLFVTFLNFCFCNSYIEYRDDITERPNKIVEHYEEIEGCLWNILYNVIFGGIVGTIGAVYGFLTRSFVLGNQEGFKEIEHQYIVKKAMEKLASMQSENNTASGDSE